MTRAGFGFGHTLAHGNLNLPGDADKNLDQILGLGDCHVFVQTKKAVELYIKFDLVAAPVIRELGYPNRHTLQNWYREYMSKGRLKKKFADGKPHPTSPYSDTEMKKAVDTYASSGKNINQTIRKLDNAEKTPPDFLKSSITVSCYNKKADRIVDHYSAIDFDKNYNFDIEEKETNNIHFF